MRKIKGAYLFLRALTLVPQILIYLLLPASHLFKADLERWIEVTEDAEYGFWGALYYFVKFMTFKKEFRNQYYYRVKVARLFALLCPGRESLEINTGEIGPGLFIQHGIATIISAKSIGKNCWINQQVTIGYSDKSKCPRIGDNVSVKAGAQVFGDIEIGDGVTIGANAVVNKDVPSLAQLSEIPRE